MEHKHFSSAVAQTGRVVAVRLFPDLDILETIAEVCEEYGIEYAQISSCIGSLRSISINYVFTPTPAPGEKYTAKMQQQGGFSLLSAQGLVSPGDEKGKRNVHLHMVVSAKDGYIFGGHVEPGTKTLTTTDLFITELNGLLIKRAKNAEGVIVTSFEEA